MSAPDAPLKLHGITWNHTRGLMPMLATAQRYNEVHPEIEIVWEKRSLQHFADAPLAQLAEQFDLLVIDHPSIGEAAQQHLLLPLDAHLPQEFLAEQAANSVGKSHASYAYRGHQYALAIDAATPVAGWRPDLLAKAEASVPSTWKELLALARRGLVAVPAVPIDSLMNLFLLANALGSEPFAEEEAVISDPAVGKEALELLRELVSLAAPGSLERNPIRTWQLLTDSDTVAYCPFAYGYSNYSRAGYSSHRLHTGGLVTLNGVTLRSTLGGAGLAISSRCLQVRHAVAYAAFVASAQTQRALYTFSGGQPGHRAAWQDAETNRHTQDFFRNTLPTLEQAWVRPRFPGFIAFQTTAAQIVHEYLQSGGPEADVLKAMNEVLMRCKLQEVRA